MSALAEQKQGNGSRSSMLDPLQSLFSMRRALLRSMFEPVEFEPMSEVVPAIDLFERNGVFMLECSLPGYRREDITVDVRPDMVTISGSYNRSQEADDSRYHQRELRRGSFVRSVPMPQDVDDKEAKATFKDGMLRIELRPSKATKGTSVPIGE